MPQLLSSRTSGLCGGAPVTSGDTCLARVDHLGCWGPARRRAQRSCRLGKCYVQTLSHMSVDYPSIYLHQLFRDHIPVIAGHDQLPGIGGYVIVQGAILQ
jgi:hypothetical protein